MDEPVLRQALIVILGRIDTFYLFFQSLPQFCTHHKYDHAKDFIRVIPGCASCKLSNTVGSNNPDQYLIPLSDFYKDRSKR